MDFPPFLLIDPNLNYMEQIRRAAVFAWAMQALRQVLESLDDQRNPTEQFSAEGDTNGVYELPGIISQGHMGPAVDGRRSLPPLSVLMSSFHAEYGKRTDTPPN